MCEERPKLKQSNSHERKVQGILEPYVFNKFSGITSSKSKYVADAVKEKMIKDGYIKK